MQCILVDRPINIMDIPICAIYCKIGLNPKRLLWDGEIFIRRDFHKDAKELILKSKKIFLLSRTVNFLRVTHARADRYTDPLKYLDIEPKLREINTLYHL